MILEVFRKVIEEKREDSMEYISLRETELLKGFSVMRWRFIS